MTMIKTWSPHGFVSVVFFLQTRHGISGENPLGSKLTVLSATDSDRQFDSPLDKSPEDAQAGRLLPTFGWLTSMQFGRSIERTREECGKVRVPNAWLGASISLTAGADRSRRLRRYIFTPPLHGRVNQPAATIRD
jgi:hypothetical protein